MTTTTARANGSDGYLPHHVGHYSLLRPGPRRGPLAGTRIIDFTWAWAGPYGAMQVALLGAETIKVESATRIDHSRQRSLAMGSFKGGVNQAPMFNEVNLNKYSIQLNLKTEGAKQIIRDLARTADGAIDNFRPGTLDKLGLGYDDLRQINPEIVMVSASALGATGPERNYTGYAPTFAALSGLSYLSGEPEEPPVMMGGSIDLRAGTAAAMAMVAGLHYRERTGRGQFIDASSSEAIGMHIPEEFLHVDLLGRDGDRLGNGHRAYAPHDVFRCASMRAPVAYGDDHKGARTGWLAIACRSDAEWHALCKCSGLDHLRDDPRFRTGLKRWKHRDDLKPMIEAWTSEQSAVETAETLRSAGVPAAASVWGSDVHHSQNFQDRGGAVAVRPPETHLREVLPPPWKLSETPAEVVSPAPRLGEDTQYVLKRMLGYEQERIDELAQQGALD
ncbi:MAG: CaiB/BaiF CoA-transferase family protein [Chloroflexi bacterium]|nr:CaiB/BaiF CoA-transferase family protein [Chloroflexota bacterium]MCY3695857.1 CaiB/BaiF CoA-transferase family protein [Chloroflexota bacterium]